jgi:phosphoribosylformylglycinamidine (FGAM) synthase-like enzyme
MQSLRFSLLAAILLAAAASSVFAQQPQQSAAGQSCALKETPALHGLRLGMTAAQVKKTLADASLFDSKRSAANNVKSSAVNISASELTEENGEGVENIYLTFVDERVAHIKVTYNSAMHWDGPQDFFARQAEKLGLPKPVGTDSIYGSGGNEKYVIACGEVKAVLAYSFGVSPNVTVSNVAARQIVDKRRDRDEEGVRETQIIKPIPSPFPRRDPVPPQTGEPHPSKP